MDCKHATIFFCILSDSLQHFSVVQSQTTNSFQAVRGGLHVLLAAKNKVYQ